MALLERDGPLRTASEYLGEAAAGHGRLVFVAAEAGGGKTSFVTAVLATAGDAVHAASGGCDGSLTPAPLAPLAEMMDGLPEQVWPPGAGQHAVFTALTTLLRRTSTPYLLVFEDVHWADAASLDLLRHLARRAHTLRALVLVTYRPEDITAEHPLRLLLGDVATAAGVRRLDLPPLSEAAVRLLRAGSGSGPSPDAASLHRMTGGNPFFVTEVLAAGADTVPATVRDAVLARVARLSPAARRVLDVVALAGPRAEADLVEAIEPGGGPALDECLERGVLRLSGGVLMFRHELARIAVAEQVPALHRIGLHRSILARLEHSPPADAAPQQALQHARMAHHAEAADDDEAVLRHAPVAAAAAAALGSHSEADLQYRRTLRHAGTLDRTRRAELLQRLAYECYLTDQIDDAVAAQQEALAIWTEVGDRVRIGDSHRWLSRLSWFGGGNTPAEEHAGLAVEALEGTGSVELAMAYSNRAHLRMLAADQAATRHWGALALDLLDRLPASAAASEVRAHVLNNLGTAAAVAEEGSGQAMLAQSLDLARDADLHEHAARVYTNLLSTAVLAHRHADAAEYAGAGLDYCAERDLDTWSLYLQGWDAMRLLNLGDDASALARAQAVVDRPRVAAISRIVPLTVTARARARLGLEGWAEPLAEAAALAASAAEVQRVVPVAVARYEIAWITGDDEAARGHAEQVSWVLTSDSSPWRRGSIATWLPAARGTARLAAPFAAETAGRWDDAAAEWERRGSRFAQPLALARGGTREGLARAALLFDATGATAAAARARALSRASGWAPPRRARASTSSHPAGLTPREAEVLDLVADGLADAQIAERLVLSRRTVEHHVSSILAKLGVESRRQAADLGGRAPEPG